MPRVSRARRLRGVLLRFVLNRPLATLAGAVLIAPAIWLRLHDYAWESGLTDGLSLLLLATGVALAWNGLTGRQSDWVDPDG
jgi:hypothetical protein